MNRFLIRNYIIIVMIYFLAACSTLNKQESLRGDEQTIRYRPMLDGKVWTMQNMNLITFNSFCQGDEPPHCSRYGRLYTWEAAKNACSLLGIGWRLPNLEEWQILAKAYGGIYGESSDNGRSAYTALTEGGNSEFDALLGGNRDIDGKYERLEAHGFYWTATEADTAEAWFINFAKGATLMNQHTGTKFRANSVRCIKDLELNREQD